MTTQPDLTFIGPDLTVRNQPNNSFYQKRNNVHIAKNQKSKGWLDPTLGTNPGEGSGPPAADRLHSHFDAGQGLTFQSGVSIDTWTPVIGSIPFKFNSATGTNNNECIHVPNGWAETGDIPFVAFNTTTTHGLIFDNGDVNEDIKYIATMCGYRSNLRGATTHQNGEHLWVRDATTGNADGNTIANASGVDYFFSLTEGTWWSLDGVTKVTDTTGATVFLPITHQFVDWGIEPNRPVGMNAIGNKFRPTRQYFSHILFYTEVPKQSERLEIKAYLESLVTP